MTIEYAYTVYGHTFSFLFFLYSFIDASNQKQTGWESLLEKTKVLAQYGAPSL